MTALARVLTRFKRRAEKRVALDEALLSERGLAYAWYRGQLLLLRIPLNIAIHVAEVIAFSAIFELGVIGPLLAIRSLPAVCGALWWGALEDLRARVRAAAGRGDWGRAERAVRSSLRLAIDTGIAGVALAVAYSQFWPSEYEGFNIFDAYALASSLRFLLDTLARTYHAGIFAVRRVHRPWWSLLVADAVELGVALSLWNLLGVWGFSIATLCGGALGAGLTFGYCRRAYREHGGFVPRLSALGRQRDDERTERANFGELGRLAVANLATHIDALLILILSRSASEGATMPFIVALHALRPLLGSVGSYARLFYFDFKRLNLRGARFFEGRFARITRRSAWLFWLVLTPLAVAAHEFLFRGQFRTELALLLVYTAVRSLLSLEQLRAFTRERYAMLTRGGLVALAVLIAARLVVRSELALIGIVLVTLAALAAWIHRENQRFPRSPPTGDELLGVFAWLAALGEEGGHVQLGATTIDARVSVPIPVVIRSLRAALPGAVFARLGRRELVWYERRGDDRAAVRARLLAASGGCLTRLEVSTIFDDGAKAREHALGWPSLTKPPTTPESPAVLRKRFREDFPDGRILNLETAPPKSFFRGRAERRDALRAIEAACLGKPLPTRRATSPRTAVYCPHGQPELVFIAPATHDAATFRAFADAVDRASFAATLALNRSPPLRPNSG